MTHREHPDDPDDPDVFVWPPRSIAMIEPARVVDRAERHGSGGEATATALMSPSPREPQKPRPNLRVTRVGTPLAPTAPNPPRSAWFQFQRTWLDLLTPPLEQRLDLLSWEPEAAGACCTRCGHTAGPHAAADDACPHCAEGKTPWTRLVRLGEYAPPLSTIVHEIKFSAWRRLGHDAGRLLGSAISRAMDAERSSLGHVLSLPPILVPVPTSFQRRLIRGIDHTLTLVRGVAATLDCPVVRALSRRHRPSQLSLPVSQRKSNVAGTMRLRVPPEKLAGRLVILMDDVTTTGATLRAAARAIAAPFRKPGLSGSRKGNGSAIQGVGAGMPIIWGGVLAVTEEGDERKGPLNHPFQG